MADARERVKSKRLGRRDYHLGRIRQATDPKAKLSAGWGLFLAEWEGCTDPEAAHRIGREVLQFLVDKSAALPRRSVNDCQ